VKDIKKAKTEEKQNMKAKKAKVSKELGRKTKKTSAKAFISEGMVGMEAYEDKDDSNNVSIPSYGQDLGKNDTPLRSGAVESADEYMGDDFLIIDDVEEEIEKTESESGIDTKSKKKAKKLTKVSSKLKDSVDEDSDKGLHEDVATVSKKETTPSKVNKAVTAQDLKDMKAAKKILQRSSIVDTIGSPPRQKVKPKEKSSKSMDKPKSVDNSKSLDKSKLLDKSKEKSTKDKSESKSKSKENSMDKSKSKEKSKEKKGKEG
jgi:hypothetical protein